MPIYAIKIGKECNKIVYSWPECQELTTGVPFAKYKKFDDIDAANEYLFGPTYKNEKTDEIDVCYLFSDGSCSGNPGPGGWGTIIRYNGQETELSGGEAHTTNNKMELTGFLNGLKFILENYGANKKIVCYSDSSYVMDGVSKWMKGWAENGWKRKTGEIANLELWKEIHSLISKIESISYFWVKGHAGHKENERCDKLAVAQTKKISSGASVSKKITNYDLFKELSADDLHLLITSTKFRNFLLMNDSVRIRDMFNEAADDWGVVQIKEFIKKGR